MKNSELSAFPVPASDQHQFNQQPLMPETGLTKREYFAGLAMCGILSAQTQTGFREPIDVAERAVRQADELLKQLENPQP